MEDNKELIAQISEKLVEDTVARVMDKIPARKAVATDAVVEMKTVMAEGLKKLENREVKALTTGTSGSGSELVPTEVASEIERVAALTGLVDKYGKKWPMQSSKVNVPTATSVSAYRVSEGSKITSSQPTTSAISLTSKTLGVIVPFSRRLLRNATPNVVDMILMLAGEAFATLRDEWAIKGLASGEGVFRHASVPELVLGTGDTTYAKIEAADLLDALNKIDANVPDANLRWVLHRSVFNVLRAQRIQMGAATGASGAEVLYPQEFLFAGYGADLPATMWNIPYSLSPILPKTADSSQTGTVFAALMDFSKVIVGTEVPYTIEMSEQATITDTDGSTLINLFEQEMVALKVTCEQDIQLADPSKAFARIKTASS